MNTFITMEALHPIFKTLPSNAVIVDVRTLTEFKDGRVPKSINIPVDEIINHAKELTHYSTVYLYCRVGGRSSAAYQLLNQAGLKNLVCVNDGGFPDWATQGFEVEKN